MLFKQIHLKGIKEGSVTLAFRKWKKPTVKKGTLLKTSIGQVEIVDITKTNISRIAKADALKAGLDHDELVKQLNSVREGDVYRIFSSLSLGRSENQTEGKNEIYSG